ncbi:MAG: trypsin-like peptidase domain-containing protein [Ruminococcus sp.]|nr:trypsin-like peptidase domain-containing protein [Ruminococcus sp.]
MYSFDNNENQNNQNQNNQNMQNSFQNYNNENVNEFSYTPEKNNKKHKRLLTAVIAMLSVVAIGATSIVGYSLITGNTLGINIKSDKDSTGNIVNAKKETSSKVDRGDLPTLIQLATPTDAMQIPDIVKKVSPSVVGISCMTTSGTVTGTGIIMSEDGYIITNAHVVDGAEAISVVLPNNYTEKTKEDDSSKKTDALLKDSDDQKTIEAELIGKDVQTDIAVIKINQKGLTAAEFGTSAEVQVGEVSIVIGNPLGLNLANSVTAGIISATDRTLTIEDRTMNLIQTDASINSGNSGGPLINAYGQVIGITSAKVASTYGEGLGFAIPIDEAIPIIKDLMENGYVTGRPTLGISGLNITEIYSEYYGVPRGFIVKSVESGSAAEQAGIKTEDIIVGIEGTLIESIEEFNEIKETYKAGDKITVSLYRNEKIVDVDVVLGEYIADDTTNNNNNNNNQQSLEDFYNNFGNQFGF